MSAAEHDTMTESEIALHAYHDGELRGLARWRFERRLRRSPELQRELAALALVSGLVRESEPAPAAVDLWEGIRAGLPAADVERREQAGGRRLSDWLAPLLRPAPAFAAAAAAALALAIGLSGGDTATGGVVHWVDGGNRSVMVLEDDADMTVIWVFDAASEGAGRGGARATV